MCDSWWVTQSFLQAKKAGMQAGWGFKKPHPFWPKPDKCAGVALGPLRSVSLRKLKHVYHCFCHDGLQAKFHARLLPGRQAPPLLHEH